MGRSQEDSLVVELTASEFRGPRETFLVDPGSDVNLVKLHALRQDMIIEPANAILITSITNDPVKRIGTVKITIFKSPVKYHVVGNELPISPDRIGNQAFCQDLENQSKNQAAHCDRCVQFGNPSRVPAKN